MVTITHCDWTGQISKESKLEGLVLTPYKGGIKRKNKRDLLLPHSSHVQTPFIKFISFWINPTIKSRGQCSNQVKKNCGNMHSCIMTKYQPNLKVLHFFPLTELSSFIRGIRTNIRQTQKSSRCPTLHNCQIGYFLEGGM